MLRSKLYCAMFALIFAFGCASIGGTPARDVYQIKSDYAAGLVLAVAYKNLPDCATPTHPVVCSQEKVIKQLQDADDIAYPTLTAAENTVRIKGATNAQLAIAAAQEAVKALTDITSKLPVK